MADLMRNSSQKAGCMRRSPASHCCQVRHGECTSAPAAVCVKPAASRAARISAGSGLEEGPCGPRFGWLLIDFGSYDFRRLLNLSFHVGLALVAGHLRGLIASVLRRGGLDDSEFGGVGGYVEFAHFHLQPLSPEARLWSIHSSDNTLIERKVKQFLKLNLRLWFRPYNA